MMNNRMKWVLAMMAILLITLACTKKEETATEETKQVASAEQKNMAMDQSKEEPPASSAVTGGKGKDVYQNTCAACHETGVSGAPKIGDKAAWEGRIAKGTDQLVQSVINGMGEMPPNAGNPSLSEEEIRESVDYMVGQVR